jgi:hypothetical protein
MAFLEDAAVALCSSHDPDDAILVLVCAALKIESFGLFDGDSTLCVVQFKTVA